MGLSHPHSILFEEPNLGLAHVTRVDQITCMRFEKVQPPDTAIRVVIDARLWCRVF